MIPRAVDSLIPAFLPPCFRLLVLRRHSVRTLVAPGLLERLLVEVVKGGMVGVVVYGGGVANLYDALGREYLWRRLYMPRDIHETLTRWIGKPT